MFHTFNIFNILYVSINSNMFSPFPKVTTCYLILFFSFLLGFELKADPKCIFKCIGN